MWFGTIPAIAALYADSPQDTHPMATMTLLTRKHDLGDIYFLDNWPAADKRQLVINDPVCPFSSGAKLGLSMIRLLHLKWSSR